MMEKNGKNQEWFAIVNPNAGNGKGGKDWNRISDILTKNDIRFEMKTTGRKGQATEFTRELIAGGYRKIISIGGDGTLNEVINGIFTQDHCLQEISLLALSLSEPATTGDVCSASLLFMKEPYRLSGRGNRCFTI